MARRCASVRWRQGETATDRVVAGDELGRAALGRGAPPPDVGVVRLDVVGGRRCAVGHDQHTDPAGPVVSSLMLDRGSVGRRARSWSVDQSTTRSRISGSVSGRTPWPRLKTCPRCPGVAAATAQHLEHRGRSVPDPAATIAGSRLPCRATWSPEPGAGQRRGRPPVDAHDVGAGGRASGRAARRCSRRSGCVARRRPPKAPSTFATGGLHEALVVAGSAPPPTSRTAGPPRRRPSTCERSEAIARSANRSISCVPERLVGVHQGLGLAVGPRRAALDEVARHREGRTGEPR